VARLLFTVQDVAESGRDDATGYGFVRPYEALTASVPPDAPNPIHDALDLEEAEPTPDGPPPVVSDGGGDERFQLPAWAGVLMLIGCLLVLVAAILLPILLVARRRRQRRATGYPGMPPPYHPGFPAGPRVLRDLDHRPHRGGRSPAADGRLAYGLRDGGRGEYGAPGCVSQLGWGSGCHRPSVGSVVEPADLLEVKPRSAK
jgi:hypothetical protein